MLLKDIAAIAPGYLSRDTIRPSDEGSHRLLQGRDVEPGILHCDGLPLSRFDPKLSGRDVELRDGDILFMARGTKNYAALLVGVPDRTLAAASFFIVRAKAAAAYPAYIVWYLNQPQAQDYFSQYSGSGVLMPVVRRAVLERLEVPVPPEATRKTIAELFRLSFEEKELTKTLLMKKDQLITEVCLRAAKRGAL